MATTTDLWNIAELFDDLEMLAILQDEWREPVGSTYDRNVPKFNLDAQTPAQCKNKFRFRSVADIRRLYTELQIPDEVRVANGAVCDGETALCMTLRRFAYPNRLADLEPLFGRNKEVISLLVNNIVNFMYTTFGHKLRDLNQTWLQAADLQRFADAITAKGSPLKNVWGFIDGTARAIARATELQKMKYNGHKRHHAVKFQSVVTPNGLVANLYGPLEGSRHDSALLAYSGLLDDMNRRNLRDRDGTAFSLYGDPAYPLRKNLMCGYKGNINNDQQQFNSAMSEVRQAMEWEFGKIVREFAFLDFKKNLKILLQPMAKYYIVGALLSNCHTCLYGSQTSSYFQLNPPSLEEYLH